MAETAMAGALAKAGYDASSDTLYAEIACELRKKSPAHVIAWLALKALKPEVRTAIARLCVRFMQADMKLPEGGHGKIVAQPSYAPDRQSDSGHRPVDTHEQSAAENGAGHPQNEAHAPSARPVLPEQKPMSEATLRGRANAAKVIAVTVLDTYRLSNGQVFGELYWSSLNRIRNASMRDAALCRLALNHTVPPDPDNTKVRDVLKVEDFQRMIQRAAEAADAM